MAWRYVVVFSAGAQGAACLSDKDVKAQIESVDQSRDRFAE
jgi:hypothetical protein